MGKRKKSGKKTGKSVSGNTSNYCAQNADVAAPISLCMIVKDEEKFLEGCLQSVRDLVGEVVIVDTGSSDRSCEIAESFGARLFHIEWKDDFSAARNFALQECRMPWILYLDADERLHQEHHAAVLQAVASGKADAYSVKIYSPVSGVLGSVPHSQVYPRLFRKFPGVQFEGKIHEQITPSLKRTNARFKRLDVTIEHLGYAQNDQVLNDKVKRNLDYLHKQVESEPENSYALFQLGQTLLLDEKVEEGINFLKKALALNQLPSNLSATIQIMLANEDFKAGKFASALQYIEKGLALAPRQRLGYFLQSECNANLFRWSEAISALEKLTEHANDAFSDLSIEKDFDDYLISQRMGLYQFHAGAYSDSLAYLTKYFKEAPDFRSQLLQKWAFAWQASHKSSDEIIEMLEYFDKNFDGFDNPEIAAKTLAGVAEKTGAYVLMEKFLQISLQYNPQNEVALYYLGNAALERNQYDMAEDYYSKALETEKNVWEIHYNLAVTQMKRQKYSRAISVLEEALELFPSRASKIQRILTGLYAKMGAYDRVMEFIKPMNAE